MLSAWHTRRCMRPKLCLDRAGCKHRRAGLYVAGRLRNTFVRPEHRHTGRTGVWAKAGLGQLCLPLFAAGWVDNAPRPIANGWLALDLAPLSGGIWQIE